jgi:hypothetical protein
MRKITRKLVLLALLAITAMAPTQMEALSSWPITLQNITKSSYFAPLYNYAATIYARTATLFSNSMNWGLEKTGKLIDHAPFIGRTELSQKIQWCVRHPQIGAGICYRKILNYREKINHNTYRKTIDLSKKTATKLFFWDGALAPDIVVPKINEALDQLKEHSVEDFTTRTLNFIKEQIKLSIEIRKRPSGLFEIEERILQKNGSTYERRGARGFSIEFKHLKDADSQDAEYTVMSRGNFYIEPEYRQHGLGHYLFSLQNAFLKSKKYAYWKIYPYPEDASLNSVLNEYYKSFGFIKHPLEDERLIIFFKNGKIDPDMYGFIDLCKAISEHDHIAAQKFLETGLKLGTPVDGIPATTMALALALDAKMFDIAHQISHKYPSCINAPMQWNNLDQPYLLYRSLRDERWDQVEFLLVHNANPLIQDENGDSIARLERTFRITIPPHIQKLLADAINKHKVAKLTEKNKE